jgi:hypothetical protein
LVVVPDIVIGAPFPLGHAGVAGIGILCALLQLSFAGCAKITVATNKEQNNMYIVFKACLVRLSIPNLQRFSS